MDMAGFHGVRLSAIDAGAPFSTGILSPTKFNQNELLSLLNPMERSSGRSGTTAPPPFPWPSPGQDGCVSDMAIMSEVRLMYGSCMRWPSNHQAHTMPSMIMPPSSSTPGRPLGVQGVPLTSTRSLSFVDQSTISCFPHSGPFGSSIMTNHHHQSHVMCHRGSRIPRRHMVEKSPSKVFGGSSSIILPHSISFDLNRMLPSSQQAAAWKRSTSIDTTMVPRAPMSNPGVDQKTFRASAPCSGPFPPPQSPI